MGRVRGDSDFQGGIFGIIRTNGGLYDIILSRTHRGDLLAFSVTSLSFEAIARRVLPEVWLGSSFLRVPIDQPITSGKHGRHRARVRYIFLIPSENRFRVD